MLLILSFLVYNTEYCISYGNVLSYSTLIFFNCLQANVDLLQREECKLVKWNPIQIILFGFLDNKFI